MVQLRRAFTSDLHQLAAMRALVREGCRQAWGEGAEEEAVASLELALNETAANVMLHAYGRQPGQPIELVLDGDAQRVCVVLYHRGEAFDAASAAPPAFEDLPESGYGLYLIRQSVDAIEYFQDEQGRCGIRLVKHRPRVAPKGGAMQLTTESKGDVGIVTVAAEQLDASNADEFRREITPTLLGAHDVVLDLGKVNFVDSRGCAAILSCLKQLAANNGDLKLCGIRKPVRNIFNLVRLNRICEIHDSREAAVRAFRH